MRRSQILIQPSQVLEASIAKHFRNRSVIDSQHTDVLDTDDQKVRYPRESARKHLGISGSADT